MLCEQTVEEVFTLDLAFADESFDFNLAILEELDLPSLTRNGYLDHDRLAHMVQSVVDALNVEAFQEYEQSA